MVPQCWGEKRYHSLNYHLRQKFGEKVFKIPLDAGFTCPNRDGTLSMEGCYFCSPRGSGDFAGIRGQELSEQFAQIKQAMHKKWSHGKYIAYFQAFSNTYGPVEKLRKLYNQALEEYGVVGIAIATRPDCLPEDVLRLLTEIKEQTYLWVELGLQTIHPETAQRLNLQYDYMDFLEALKRLQDLKIETCAHIILGLPDENTDDMMTSARALATLPLQGVKIHLLHLMRDTPLHRHYQERAFSFLSKREYVKLVVDILEILPPELIIHRLTGDSPRNLLVGPEWSLNKWEILNSIDREFILRNSWQGKHYVRGE